MLLFIYFIEGFALLSTTKAINCDENFVLWNGHCYYASDVKVTFNEALVTCSSLNTEIVSIHTNAETNFVNTLAGFQPIWLGLKHLKGGWVWTDDSPLDYVNWHSSQPDRCCGTDVSCVTTNWIFENGKWFDSSCQALSGIVCKYNPQTRQVQPSSDTSDYGTIVDKKSNTKCDNAFIPWRGNCYYSSPTKVTYQRAFILCAAMNANLYTSHSAEEDAFVSRLAEYKSIWLGLNKIRNDWVWSDLSKLDYQNWQRFQPDNCCGKHVLCAELRWIHNKPKWMDTCCMKNYGVVCKYNATTGRINAVRAPAIINQLSGILTADQSLSTTTSTTATLTTTSAPSNSFQPIRSQQTDFVFATPPSFSEFTIPHLTQQLNYIQQNIPKSFYKNEYNQANNYYPEADTKLSQNKATEHKKLAANQATKSQGYYTTNDQFSTHSPTPLCRCPKNWVLFNDYCYQVYKSSSGPLTTIVAAAKCRRMGAELASACSDSEFALFENMAKPFEMHDPLFGLMVDKLFGGCTMSSTDRKTVCCHINWLYGTPKFGEGKWNTCPAYSPDSFNERSQCALTKYASVYGCKLPCQPTDTETIMKTLLFTLMLLTALTVMANTQPLYSSDYWNNVADYWRNYGQWYRDFYRNRSLAYRDFYRSLYDPSYPGYVQLRQETQQQQQQQQNVNV